MNTNRTAMTGALGVLVLLAVCLLALLGTLLSPSVATGDTWLPAPVPDPFRDPELFGGAPDSFGYTYEDSNKPRGPRDEVYVRNGSGQVPVVDAASPSGTYQIGVAPGVLTTTQFVNEVATRTLTISNGNGVTLTFAVNEPGALPIQECLVAYYPFDGNANDESGNGNNGMVQGATLTTDRLGFRNSAYSFDGVNDYIRVPDDESLDLVDGLTIAAWIKSDNTSGARDIVAKWNDYDRSDCAYIFKDHNSSDKLRIELSKGYFNNLADLEGTTSIPVGPWIHVAATFDSNSVRLYFDGVEDAVSTALGSIDSSSADLFVGALGAGMGEYFDGSIDDVCIFNRALVETEIQSLRNWRGGIVSPWLSIKPITGTVPPHGSIPIQVTFDASGMQPGMYGTEIAVRSNDPVMPSVSVPVTMTVLPTANMGWVEGTVTDARTGDPLQATVITLDQPYTVTTDPVTGHYILWLDEGNYTLQVSAAGYVTATAVVDIVAQEGATQGFALASIGTRTSYLPLAWKNTE